MTDLEQAVLRSLEQAGKRGYSATELRSCFPTDADGYFGARNLYKALKKTAESMRETGMVVLYRGRYKLKRL